MLKISRESEINLINVLIDNDIISGKDLINIKKVSTEGNKSQIAHIVCVLPIRILCLVKRPMLVSCAINRTRCNELAPPPCLSKPTL